MRRPPGPGFAPPAVESIAEMAMEYAIPCAPHASGHAPASTVLRSDPKKRRPGKGSPGRMEGRKGGCRCQDGSRVWGVRGNEDRGGSRGTKATARPRAASPRSAGVGQDRRAPLEPAEDWRWPEPAPARSCAFLKSISKLIMGCPPRVRRDAARAACYPPDGMTYRQAPGMSLSESGKKA